MFWTIFYWACAGIFCVAMGAVNFFAWKPAADTVAFAAFFAGMVACHSMARQNL